MQTYSENRRTGEVIRVLLVSPRLPAGDNRYCGDHAYTDTLLRYPPPGVRYYHYEDLLADGRMRRLRFLQAMTYYLTEWGILPPDVWFEALLSDFTSDILHICGFSVVVHLPRVEPKAPVVMGISTGSFSDLKYYRVWDERHIRRARIRKRRYLQLIGAYDTSLQPERAAKVLVWSEFAKSMHLQEGYVRPDQLQVLYPGLPWHGDEKRRIGGGRGLTFLFVGRDFERKNGPLVLEAFRALHQQYPETRLILVSKPRSGQTISELGVTHYHFVPRQELLERIYPQADVLLLPSKAEGFGLVLLEAMSFGLPVIAVDAWAMREIVVHGENGFLIRPDSIEDLSQSLWLCASDPGLVSKMSRQAGEHFSRKFSIDYHNQCLRAVYDQLLAN